MRRNTQWKRKNMKNQKGITVLSLVVAIVVLSALIGVSLAMLFGGTGKISNAAQNVTVTNTTNSVNK